MDCVSERLGSGRWFRALTIVDNFTCECPAIEVDASLTGARVAAVLEHLKRTRGVPLRIKVDNGPPWTPDGRGLTYVDAPDGVGNIWLQPLAGGPPKRLTDFKSNQIFRFDWSRDRKRLVCSRGAATNDVVLISGLRLIDDEDGRRPWPWPDPVTRPTPMILFWVYG